MVVANSFAYDIKDILEEFIDDDIREEIKWEFLEMSEPADYEPLNLEIESRLENMEFIEAVALILTTGIAETLNSPSKLERYMKRLS